MAGLEARLKRLEEAARDDSVWSVVYERDDRFYDAWPWGADAHELTQADVDALPGNLIRITYVDNWRALDD
jgi:hypothetical protein